MPKGSNVRAAYSVDGEPLCRLFEGLQNFDRSHIARDTDGVLHALIVTNGTYMARCHYMFYETGEIGPGMPTCIECVVLGLGLGLK